jgi:hypothetical protein
MPHMGTKLDQPTKSMPSMPPLARAQRSGRRRKREWEKASYATLRAARSGAGVNAAATITSTKAKLWMTMPSV